MLTINTVYTYKIHVQHLYCFHLNSKHFSMFNAILHYTVEQFSSKFQQKAHYQY